MIATITAGITPCVIIWNISVRLDISLNITQSLYYVKTMQVHPGQVLVTRHSDVSRYVVTGVLNVFNSFYLARLESSKIEK